VNEIEEITVLNQVSIPKLGLGTWEMGGRQIADYSEDKKWIAAINLALQAGIKLIDTAAVYGNGHAEELVGQAISNFDRKNIFITTKVSGDKLQFAEVIQSAKQSLKRLGITQLDLFLIHWPSQNVPLSETIRAIDTLISEGLILHFGLSNFPVKLMQEVMQLTENKIITNQIEYNLMTRETGMHNQAITTEIIPFCIRHGISITAWRPILKGNTSVLTNQLVQEIANKYNKTGFQIMLNWLFSKPLTIVIPKMSSKQHILENIAATKFRMDESDMKRLNNISV